MSAHRHICTAVGPLPVLPTLACFPLILGRGPILRAAIALNIRAHSMSGHHHVRLSVSGWTPAIRLATSLCGVLLAGYAVALDSTDATQLQLRESLRAHLRSPLFALDRKPEYVVTDAAVVEPALDEALRYVDMSRAPSGVEVAAIQRRAESAYRRRLAMPEGLRALEALIGARFAQPRVTQEANPNCGGKLVTLDHGRMPGPLRADGGSPYPSAEGPEFSNGVPASTFIAHMIAKAAAAYPDADQVVVRFTLPTHRRAGEYRVSYQRRGWPQSRNGWLTIQTLRATGLAGPYETRVYRDDFSAYTSGRYSVYEKCAELIYLPRSQAQAEGLKLLAGRCLNYGRDSP